MYKWYCSLIKARKDYPILTEGELVSCKTDDETGYIEMVRRADNKEIIAIFNGKDKPIALSKYNGQKDLITGEIFDGELVSYSAVLFEK